MVEATKDSSLKLAFRSQLAETRDHAQRLETILGKLPGEEPCKAMQGSVKEASDWIGGRAAPAVMDAGLIAEGQRAEHYETAGYGTARALADAYGETKAASLLDQILQEEGAADKKLTALSQASTRPPSPDGKKILVGDGAKAGKRDASMSTPAATLESPAAPASADKKTSLLEQLKQFSKVVADTGDFGTIKAFTPQDATTNPSLIYAATQRDEYKPLLEKAIVDNQGSSLTGAALMDKIGDRLLVLFGTEILKIVPGRVSTETDARLAFDTEAIVQKGRELIVLYKKEGIDRERVLIKIASTWEGIRAAEILQKEGIKCNLTLLFSVVQAAACAEAGTQLISPFRGRIYDWDKKSTGKEFTGAEDPGVQSTSRIYNYYKKFGYPTEVMGASFRNITQITELAGSDLLTISPKLLAELQKADTPTVERKLDPEKAKAMDIERVPTDEKSFRFLFNEDAMATEKTSEGIRSFVGDTLKMEKGIAEQLEA